VRQVPERAGIMPKLADFAEKTDSPVAEFLHAYIRGDEQTMRGIARQLVAS
jgi:hypothetical protein